MQDRAKKKVTVVKQECLVDGIYSMWIKVDETVEDAKAGQFVSLYTNDPSKLLPRPISICDINRNEGMLRLVYRVTGENTGTKQFSILGEGDEIAVLAPLGNGYDLEKIFGDSEEKKICVMGGGIGIPPMLGLAKEIKRKYPKSEIKAVLGYRDKNTFLAEEFEKYCDVFYSSDNGEVGIRGNVIDAMKHNGIEADVICACGPMPMLKGVCAYAKEKSIECYVSLEEKMACGIGACLACVCKTKEKDEHSKVNNKRVCKEGPVFNAYELDI